MSISDEAVEAAAIAWVGKQVWQDCNDAWKTDYMERSRTILDAAAPHMLAEAWEAGYHAHMTDWSDYQTPNPYRSHA